MCAAIQFAGTGCKRTSQWSRARRITFAQRLSEPGSRIDEGGARLMGIGKPNSCSMAFPDGNTDGVAKAPCRGKAAPASHVLGEHGVLWSPAVGQLIRYGNTDGVAKAPCRGKAAPASHVLGEHGVLWSPAVGQLIPSRARMRDRVGSYPPPPAASPSRADANPVPPQEAISDRLLFSLIARAFSVSPSIRGRRACGAPPSRSTTSPTSFVMRRASSRLAGCSDRAMAPSGWP